MPTRSDPETPLTDNDWELFRQAMQHAHNGEHTLAATLGAKGKDALAQKAILWLRLTDEGQPATYRDLITFLHANDRWPGTPILRRRIEQTLPWDTPSAEVVDHFRKYPPLTSAGVLRNALALPDVVAPDEAAAYLRKVWINTDFAPAEEDMFLQAFGDQLTQADHRARADRLAWDGRDTAISRMRKLVSPGYMALIQARRALARMDPGVDAAIRAVPKEFQDDPGFSLERLRWRRKKDRPDAFELLKLQPRDPTHLEEWWQERQILARRLMDDGKWRQAYDVTAAHGQLQGGGFAQAEFLAGWIALRKLKQPVAAFAHFDRLYRGVSMPISLARGAYWAGEAAAAAGDKAIATQWYQAAAVHTTTYYGQLAASHLDSGTPLPLPEEPKVDAATRAVFQKDEMARLAHLMHELGEEDLTRLVLTRMMYLAKTGADYVLTADLADNLGFTGVAVETARQATTDQFMLTRAGYPQLDKLPDGGIEPALIHALVRQESNFDPEAHSHAGARGLMQLMPGTAQDMAKKLGRDYKAAALTGDEDYNLALGEAYIGNLISRFNGSYILAIAAYNAGPGRVRGWMKEMGDPRDPGQDPVDWIEEIPIYETRNYVQRVLENLHVYRLRFGQRETIAMAVSPELTASRN